MTKTENTLWLVLAGAVAFGSGMTTQRIADAAGTKAAATDPPAKGALSLTAHDAAGRTLKATATYNTLSADGKTAAIDYTTDQVLCSGFGQ